MKKPKEHKIHFVQGSLGQIIAQFPGIQTPQTTLTYAQVKELGLLGNTDVIVDRQKFEQFSKSTGSIGEGALMRIFANRRDADLGKVKPWE
jgi:hypothetical protein